MSKKIANIIIQTIQTAGVKRGTHLAFIALTDYFLKSHVFLQYTLQET
jgi:hypothetical protein